MKMATESPLLKKTEAHWRRRLKSENASAIAKEGMRAGFIVTAHSTFFISPPSLLPKDRRGERLLGLHFKYSDSDLFASV